MNIKEILDKLDSKIFPEEIKKELVESFTTAVNEKITEVTSKLETSYIDKEIALEKKYTKKIENFYESERVHINQYLQETQKQLKEELITKYSDEVLVEDALKMYRKMQNFISESSSKLNTKPEQIKESEKLKEQNIKLQEDAKKEKQKFLMLARSSIVKENYDKIKTQQIKEQFEKLVEEIEFEGDVKNFTRKLERVRENLENEYANILESLKKEATKKEPEPIKETKKEEVKKPATDRLKEIKESLKNKSTKHDIIVENKSVESKSVQNDMSEDLSVY
jgi:hypothetical protein